MKNLKAYKEMNFSTLEEDRRNGYQAFMNYYEAFCDKKDKVLATDGTEMSFAEMEKRQLEFFKSEINIANKFEILGKQITMNDAIRPEVQRAAFEVVNLMTELILPNAMKRNGLDRLVDFRYIGWGDTAKFTIRSRDLFVVSKASKAGVREVIHERTFDGEIILPTETRQLTVEVSLFDILTGKYSLAEFVNKVVLSLENNLRKDIYNVLVAGTANLSQSGSNQLYVAGYNEEDYIKLAQKIGAWNGSEPLAYGTKLALRQVMPAGTGYTAYTDLGSDFVRLGYITDFAGVKAVELEQLPDYTVEFGTLLDDNKIFLVSGNKPIKVVFEGTPLAYTSGEFSAADMKVKSTMLRNYGVGFITGELVGCVALQ